MRVKYLILISIFMLINLNKLRTRFIKLSMVVLCCLSLQACLGTIVGTTADVAIEVAKIPFKVGGAVIDVATGDGKSKKDKKQEKRDEDEEAPSSKDQRAI